MCAICIPSAAHGFNRDKIDSVVIIGMSSCCEEESWLEAEETLRAELTLEDIPAFFWDSLAKNKTERLDEMKRAAESRNATAVIRITRDTSFSRVIIDLWVTDSGTGRSTYRQFLMRNPEDKTDTLDLAVRTVEALRASIHELKMKKAEPPPSPKIYPATQTGGIEMPRFAGGSAVAVEKSPGGLGTRGGFALALVLEPILGLDLECNVYYSPLGDNLDTESATTELDYMMVRGLVFYRFQTPFLLEPAVGIGAGSLFVWASGRDLENKPLHNDRARVAMIGGGIRLYARINRSFYLVMGTFAGAALPQIHIYHGKKKAVSFGRPMMDGHVGIQVRFPN